MNQSDSEPRLEKRQLKVALPKEAWAALEALADVQDLSVDLIALRVLDHVQQGLCRELSWERQWCEQAFGEEAIELAEQRLLAGRQAKDQAE